MFNIHKLRGSGTGVAQVATSRRPSGPHGLPPYAALVTIAPTWLGTTTSPQGRTSTMIGDIQMQQERRPAHNSCRILTSRHPDQVNKPKTNPQLIVFNGAHLDELWSANIAPGWCI